VGDTVAPISVDGVGLTPLNIINVPNGDVLHCMRQKDFGYAGFGEAYFSFIEAGAVKGWKRHRRMFLNLVVPVGAVRFVIYDDRCESHSYGVFQEVTLSVCNYQRLTVPPLVWVAFQGSGEQGGMLLNIASIEHDPNEADRKAVEEIAFDW